MYVPLFSTRLAFGETIDKPTESAPLIFIILPILFVKISPSVSTIILNIHSFQLTSQTQISTSTQSSRAGNAMAAANTEIARFREILRQIDELEVEFDKVRHIRDIVRGFRARVEGLERRVDGRRR